MQANHSLGALAERIIAVSFRLDGTVTPILRRRESGGRMVTVAQPRVHRDQHIEPTEFVARVEKGNSAVAAIGPKGWQGEYCVGVIPLGNCRPSALPTSPAPVSSDAALTSESEHANPDEIRFRYADGKLTWRSENVSGETVINETYPELTVALRLPPGNQGEISFASPLFTTADGEPASVLSVA